MRGVCLLPLVFLLCSEHALGLQCYTCGGSEDISQCQPITCVVESSVCYGSLVTMTLTESGKKIRTHHKGCAPSCNVASKLMEGLTFGGLGQVNLPKLEVQDISCCEEDLCNGVAHAGHSLWALAGGLLLSLGPTLLRALQ